LACSLPSSIRYTRLLPGFADDVKDPALSPRKKYIRVSFLPYEPGCVRAFFRLQISTNPELCVSADSRPESEWHARIRQRPGVQQWRTMVERGEP
jgi:hypothetical protein